YGSRLRMVCPPGVGSTWCSTGGLDTVALDGHSWRPGRARDGCARSRSKRIAPPTALGGSVVGQTLPGLSNRCQDARRESPADVQRQLGHASIKLTVDRYGKWLPMGNKAAVDRLDDPTGSKVVARTATTGKGVLEVPRKNGEPWWDRTTDPLIKS